MKLVFTILLNVFILNIGSAQWLQTSFEEKEISNAILDARRLCCEHSVTFDSSIVADGKYSLKFTLNKDDSFYRDNGELRKKAKKRAEIGTIDNVDSLLFRYDGEYWYTFKVFIPESWIDEANVEDENRQNRDIISQWHWKKERASESGRPALSIAVNGDKWTIINSYQTGNTLDKESEISSSYFAGKVQKGIWVKWTVNALWSNEENRGFIKIWKDDLLIADLKGANSNKDRNIIYKFGLYKPRWTSRKTNVATREIYFDDIGISKEPFQE